MRADACVLDLDGTLYQGGAAIPGAAVAVAALRSADVPVCFATNTTRQPRSALVRRLAELGIAAVADDLFTAPVAAARWLADQGAQRVSLLLPEVTHAEFAGFTLDDEAPEYVVVGDLGSEWTFARLDRAFRALLAGATLVAIHRNRWWNPGGGPTLDAGAFVAALEYASGREAVLVGKPSEAFLEVAAAELGVPRGRVVVVGDGIENDVRAAQRAGCLGVLVRTGTFRPADLATPGSPPDGVLDSVADLPGWLGIEA